MEALALLCTLHADGPATLRRLHRAGCHSLQRLEQYAPDELAEILELPPAVARRLGREAKSLAHRLDLSPAGDPSTTAYGLGDHEEAPEITTPSGPEALEPRTPLSSALDRRDRVVLDRVLERWRSAPAGDGDAGAALVGDADRTVSRARPAAEAREPEVVPALPSIPVGAIDGLDAEVSAHLAQLGVSDLGTLATTEPGLLARALGLSYARVRRLQFLAGRAQPVAPAASAAPIGRVARPARAEAPQRPVEPAAPVRAPIAPLEPIAARPAVPPIVPAQAEAPAQPKAPVPPAAAQPAAVPPAAAQPAAVPPAAAQPAAVQPAGGIDRVAAPAASATAPAAAPAPAAARPAAPAPPTYQAPILVHDEPPRRKFWEPRIQREAARAAAAQAPAVQAPAGTAPRVQAPVQAPAAAQAPRPVAQAAPVPPPPPAPSSAPRAESTPRVSRRGVTLHWNFELHPPPGTARAAAPLPEPSWSATASALPQRDAERDRDLGDEGAAGPFA